METAVFIILAIFFQYYIGEFNNQINYLRGQPYPTPDDKVSAATTIKDAMKVATISFTFPLKIFMTYIFSHKTDRSYIILSGPNIIDLLLFVLVTAWLIVNTYYNEYKEGATNEKLY